MDANLSLYKIFCTVASTRSISRAAKELYISQPAISRAIQKLEANLGAALFLRTSRGVSLTREGELLYSHVADAFTSISRGEEALRRELSGQSGTLHIGVSSTLCKYLLLPYLKGFIQENPSIRVYIACQSTAHTVRMLEQQQLDLGLIAYPGPHPQLTFQPIGEIHDVFVATSGYMRNLGLPKGADTSVIFASATIMLLDKENITRQYINDFMLQNHIEAPNFLEVTDMDLLIEFSRISLGIGCVIREFVQEDLEAGLLTEIPLDIPIHTRAAGFSYKKSPALSGPLQRFLDYFARQGALFPSAPFVSQPPLHAPA